MADGRTGEPQANQRLTVAQAAERLNITEGAVRSRIKRGTLPTTKDGGTVYVLLGGGTSGANQSSNTDAPSAQAELLAALRDEIAHLRRESERKDAIIMSLSQANAEQAQTIRAIEAPSSPADYLEDEETLRDEADMSTRPDEQRQEWHAQRYGAPRGSPERGEEQQSRGTVPTEQQTATSRPWWRRIIGG